MKVRTRFAPSPTGFLHIGGLRTALFAWLVARQNDGVFMLRIEDTDVKREVEGAEAHIMESMRWLGLEWDEGPDKGGPTGPYRQSERIDSYKKWAEKLIDKGLAYADPTSAEELEKLRETAKNANKPFHYREYRPKNPPEWDGKTALRFKIDADRSPDWEDLIRGPQAGTTENIDDFIIMKADGYPTYNFAHIVDDAEMEITHIIRGQEFVSSVPKYMLLYQALELTPPKLAHVPVILGASGGKKLGKRDGAKDALDYRADGYLPEAMNNFLASLGWSDGTEQDVFTTDELITKFDLSRVQKSPARFDIDRLNWLNAQHIRRLAPRNLDEHATDFWPESAGSASEEYKSKVLMLFQDRLKYFSELSELSEFFFTDLPVDPKLISEHKQLKKLDKSELKELLTTSRTEIEASDFSVEDLTDRLNVLLEKTGQKPAVLFSLIRIAITQAPASPGLADTLATLGKDVSLRRIDAQLKLW